MNQHQMVIHGSQKVKSKVIQTLELILKQALLIFFKKKHQNSIDYL